MFFGVWRSLVAHLVWDQGAAGSNPVTPTTTSKQSSLCFDVLFFKERLRLLSCFSLFPKSLTTFWEPYACGDFFTKVTVRSFCYVCVGTDFALFRFLFAQKSVTRCVVPPSSQKVLRLFGSPTPSALFLAYWFAATFLQKSPCTHSAIPIRFN